VFGYKGFFGGKKGWAHFALQTCTYVRIVATTWKYSCRFLNSLYVPGTSKLITFILKYPKT
jgi:hypothetical protein